MAPMATTGLLTDAGIRVEQEGAVVSLSLARPGTRNAQTPATWRGLAAVGASLGPDVRAIIIRAEGKSFSAGLDRRMFAEGIPGEVSLASLARLTDAGTDSAIEEFQRGFACWRECDAITVAAVQGHAVGAGFQLALAADLMVVADDVQLSMRETQLGLVPDLGGSHALVAAVGYSRALEICATGRWIHAGEAVASGIAVASTPREQLDEFVQILVQTMLHAPAGALTETKHLLRGASNRTPQEQQAAERHAQRRRILDLASAINGQ